MKEKDIAFETERFWVLKTAKGYEVYEIGITHSTRCSMIGWKGAEGLERAKKEITRREAQS